MRNRYVSALTVGAVAVGSLVLAAPSHAVTGPVACPESFPTDQAVDGVTGTGYTVERGTTPAPFTATVLGRITDGIAPGVDMIMADLDSPAIQRAGVWAGMSGSPVYTGDGRLIGSVSYGLAASSPIAGITPAVEMKKLLNQAPAASPAAMPAIADKVKVSGAVAKRLAATGEVTAAAAAGGFERLKVPVTVSGLSQITNAKTQARLTSELAKKMPGARILSGGTAAPTGSTPADIVAGGNFAASVAYGDVTFGGVGTTTFVCNGQAVAFGHPFLFNGVGNAAVHAASAVYVQSDPVFGSFKVANLGSVVGTLDKDGWSGIRGTLGAGPAAVTLTSTLSVAGGATRTGTTKLVNTDYAWMAEAYHVLYNGVSVLDAEGPGTAKVTFTARGVRANGSPFTLTRTDRISSSYDISAEAAMAAADMVQTLVGQPFEQVRLTSVDVSGTLSPTFKQYRVTGVKVKQGTKYVTPTQPVTVKAGSKLAVRVSLAPYKSTVTRNVDLFLTVPAGTSRRPAMLNIAAGPVWPDLSSATTFPQVLTALRNQPAGNSVRATLTIESKTGSAKVVKASALLDQAIAGAETMVDVQIK